jgi:hypothetical protein
MKAYAQSVDRFEISASAAFTSGARISGQLEVLGAKVGFAADAGSVEVVKGEFSTAGSSFVGPNSDMKQQTRELSIGVGPANAGYIESSQVKSVSTLSLANPTSIERYGGAVFATVGSVRSNNDHRIQMQSKIGLNVSFFLGVNIEVSATVSAKDSDVTRNYLNGQE